MHVDVFIHDIAIIMLTAGIVTLLFHHFKQPVVLGYIVAGVLIGPHTPPFELIQDKHTINILAELGVVFLMFSLGLEFNLRKLASVGATAFVAALAEIILMLWVGYKIGTHFGWGTMNALFLGAMLSISSTTIIVKALDELGMKTEKFAQLIFGILIIEDILAIGMIALLSGIATTGTVNTQDILSTVGRLSLFMIVALILGLLTIPRFLAHIAKFKNNEMLLITTLGLCFAFCLMVIALDYSIALGAFMVGAIIAESKPQHLIEKLVTPIRDMFSAVFFVTIGMLFDPQVMLIYSFPIIVITIALILSKILACSVGSFVTGQSGRTSLRVGMGLAQIGEFSFIIAALGLKLNVTSKFLYPIAVAVSAVTTLLTPYLIKLADPLSRSMQRRMPKLITRLTSNYTTWVTEIYPKGDKAIIVKIIVKIVMQIIVNCTLVIAVFLAGIFVATNFDQKVINDATGSMLNEQIHRSIICGLALFISLPFLIAAYRKLKALAMILSEIWVSSEFGGKHTYTLRRIIFEFLPLIAISLIMTFVFSISHHILPDNEILAAIVIGEIILAIALWGPMVKLQSWLQIELFTVMEPKPNHD